MQEESGEIECSESNGVPVWACPLCQQGQTNRDALAVHLTQRHSVLPACLDRLLDTAAPVDCASEDNVEADSQSDIVNTSASPAAPAPQLIPQQQLLLPLFLNGLQAQAQNPNSESASPVLTQPVSVLGVSAAQQALLAQRLSSLQSLSLAVGNSAAIHTSEEENEKGENAGEKEIMEEQRSTLQSEKKDGEEERLKDNNKMEKEARQRDNVQDPACPSAKVKPPSPKHSPLVLSEFQSQVLWAFLESRSETDAASPLQEDCEALSLEVGLEMDEVRRWLWDARETREKDKFKANEHASCKLGSNDQEAKEQSLPNIGAGNIMHQLPLSVSLAPFATQFISPYVLQLPASAVGLGINVGDENRGKAPTFTNPPAITRCSGPFPDPLNAPPPVSHSPSSRFLPNGGDYESALDLSIGKNKSSSSSSSSPASLNDKVLAQRDRLLDGLGLRPTTVGVPSAGGLIVVRVKPESALAIPTSTNSATVSINSNNNAKSNAAYIKPAERVSNSVTERQRDKEREREKEHKNPKARRYRDMRRSRTIIQTEQLDVLYGCYFKDPNPGKHEFEQISEWVHLPKKVVQIWFQNMRARERKGEVRFISDGTLAAVGKPLIKFTWPLQKPIFSSSPKPNTSAVSSSGVTKVPPAASPVLIHPKTRLEQQKEKDKEALRPKLETQNPAATAKVMPKANAVTAALPEVVMEVRSTRPYSSQNHKGDKEEITDDEEEEPMIEKIGPGTTNRMIPKQSTSACNTPALGSQKHNGLNYWSPKGPFKINTLSREQLGLSTVRASVAAAPVAAPATSTPPSGTIKSTHVEGAFLHHSTPRRPRTHLTSLQLSILQSCYETCAHPNALECETVGTELGLPLKVVQIWFQNTRAKEKRWRLQQEKQFPGSTDSKKVEFHAGSYLQYSALRANRPILPKPVQLTVLEPATPPAQGQSAGRETLRGRCEACGIGFESRAAARAHVFSPRHLATLRATNFGQPPSLVNNCTGSTSGSGVAALSSSPSPAISTS
ncbi:hypothetical protein AGOR_G00174500 [Albula goreensis]|uniref:Homeobox domain-containing protein n=1 Tax=Albula goreensis TaxID=1534307 RepID=A0A8T3D2F1_9TELE|nr:hypothetical protein AGOR_G00174500 [Albula goreensis]